MNKESLFDKIIKRFYGITGPFDEQKRQQANKLGNQVFICLSWFLLFANAIVLTLANQYPQIISWAYPAVVELVLLGLFFYITWKSHQTHLTDIEPELQSPKEEKQFKHNTLKIFCYSALTFYVFISVFRYLTDGGKTLFNIHTQLHLLAGSFISALIITIPAYFMIQLRIKNGREEEE